MANLRYLALLGSAWVTVGACFGCAHSDETTQPEACVTEHPRDGGTVAPADVLSNPISQCQSDEGACVASVPCTGFAKERICDESKFITAAAAVCIATAAGLEPGLDGPKATLVYNFGFRRMIWGAGNTIYDRTRGVRPADGESGDAGGQSFSVDAVTGLVLGKAIWSVIKN